MLIRSTLLTMRCAVIVGAILVLTTHGAAKDRHTVPVQPNQFEIGRRTFFDFGPPFNYYELFIGRAAASGASIERIIVTPPGNVCLAPAKVEIARASIDESPQSLLASKNLCSIPEKEVQRELKRCKHCSVFSGANVVMRVQCGTQTRLIRSDILDRDWFDSAAKTPEHTSSTMRLLSRLGDAVGPGVMDKPMFEIPDDEKRSAKGSDSETLLDLGAGKYDELFKGAPDKPSELYQAAQTHPPAPSVRLLNSMPFSPEVFVQPTYPVLARMASVEGVVSIKVEIDSSGAASNLTFEGGPQLLRGVVAEAVKTWRFPSDAFNQQVQVKIEFALNCHVPAR
jgi:hypothetical protein